MMDFFGKPAESDNEWLINWDAYENTPILTLRNRPTLEWFPCFSTLVELRLDQLPALKLLPHEFTNLKSLEVLQISYTGLKRLPGNMHEMKHLADFTIYGNEHLALFMRYRYGAPPYMNTLELVNAIRRHYGSREVACLLLWARDLIWKHIPRDVMKIIAKECIESVACSPMALKTGRNNF